MTSWTSPQTNDNTGTQYNLKLTCDDLYHPIHPVQNTHEHTITSGSCLICECVQSAFITGQMILQPCQLPDPHCEWADENKAWCFMCSGCTPMKRMISWFPLFPVFFWWVCDDDPEGKKNRKTRLDLLANGVTMRIDKLCPKNRRLQAGSTAELYSKMTHRNRLTEENRDKQATEQQERENKSDD